MKRKSYRANNPVMVGSRVTETQFQDTFHAGTTRDGLEGGCYLFDVDSTIDVVANSGDISSVSGLDRDNNIITLTATFVTDHYEITAGDGNYAWNIKCWATGITPTDDQRRSYTLIGSGGAINLFTWFKGDEKSGATAYSAFLSGVDGTIMNAVTVPKEDNPNSFHQRQDVFSWQNTVGYSSNVNVLPSTSSTDIDFTLLTIGSITSSGRDFFTITYTPTGGAQTLTARFFPNAAGQFGYRTGDLVRVTFEIRYQYQPLTNTVFALQDRGGSVRSGFSSFPNNQPNTFIQIDSILESNGNSLSVNSGIVLNINHLSGGSTVETTIEVRNILITYEQQIIIPRDESQQLPPFVDVLGNALQFIGHCQNNADWVNSACFQGGNSAYLSVPGLLATDTISSVGNGSATPTISAGRLDFTDDEIYYDIHIERATVEVYNFPLSEPIVNASSHTYYNKLGSNHATLTNGAAANYGRQDEFHDLMFNGFTIKVDNSFVPKHATNNTDAEGNVLTHPQDGESFLDCRTEFRNRLIPELIQADTTNEFYQVDGTPIDRTFSSIVGVSNDKNFADVSQSSQGIIKNIRIHKAALVRGQLDTERQITNNS